MQEFNKADFKKLKYLTDDFIESIEKAHNDELYGGDHKARFYAIVTRNRKLGQQRGFIELIDTEREEDEGVILQVPLITGSKEPNPAAYGGCTPPFYWNMCERIERRDHPAKKRKMQTMARIHPIFSEDIEDYDKRTFNTHGDYAYPFMTHAGGYYNGASTGCLAVVKYWNKYVEWCSS